MCSTYSFGLKGEGLKSLQQTYAAQIAKTRKDAFTLRLNQALRFVPEITKRALEYTKYPGSSNWLTVGASEELHHLSASEFRDGIATRYGFEPPDMPALITTVLSLSTTRLSMQFNELPVSTAADTCLPCIDNVVSNCFVSEPRVDARKTAAEEVI
ncbi:hypothetical protein GJ496_001004 [Pomphorhynchus laevis]|nr:hypothetical protein GJ496_001004 [Pomphorhynchus laevis]